MTRTANLDLYYLDDGQRAADGAMNENLAFMDVLVLGRVQDNTLTDPPADPDDGDAYIVAATATAVWAGQEDSIAYWYDEAGAWQFIVPKVGWGPFYVIGGTNAGKRYSYEAGTPDAWQEYSTGGGGAAVTIITPDTTTTHAATAGNNGGMLVFNTSSDCILTLPEQGSEALAAGFHLLVKNIGGGNVSIALEGTDTIQGVPLMQNPNEPITIILEVADEPNVWSTIGNTWLPAAVDNMDLTAPPATPDLGAVFVPAATATGAWAGQENTFAIHTGGDNYAFADVPPGWHVYDINTGNATVYTGSTFECPTCMLSS